MRRLSRYVLGVLALLAAVEALFRLREVQLAASAHRVATKVALLEAQGSVEVLFLGTSRTWDAVSPRAFSAELDALQPGLRARGFNLAVTSSNLDLLESLATRFARRPGLRLAIIELSEPQVSDPPPVEEAAPGGIEALAGRFVKLIAHRAALRGESLERLPQLLLYPRVMDGSEVRFSDQLSAVLSRVPERAAPVDLTPLRPAPVPASEAPPDVRARRMMAVARVFGAAGVPVAFMVPPVQPREREPMLRGELSAIAREWPVWDFEAAPLPAAMFRDLSHLNPAGRALFSRLLALETARAGVLGTGLARRAP